MVNDELMKRLRYALGGVSVDEHMHGDNLAILLCSFYEDAEGETDDNGWTETATIGCEKTLDVIHAHYSDAIEALTAARDEADALIAATFADAAENNIRLAELSHRVAELEAAIDSIEAENGITSNGNMWRFWSKQAQELATKVDAESARAEAAEEELMAAQGQIADAQAAEARVAELEWAAREVHADCLMRAKFSRDGKTVPIGASAWITLDNALNKKGHTDASQEK